LPYYWYLDRAMQGEFDRNINSLMKWIQAAIERFRSGVKNSRVIELRKEVDRWLRKNRPHLL
jgi:hypothetical protein